MTFFAMRKGERRDACTAFLTLFALIASHSVLETARDALFLSKIPATRLPWMFLSIAIFSIGTVKLNAWATDGRSPRRVLAATTLSVSIITTGFFALERRLGALGLYALYVWSGLLASVLLVHFWDLVGARFTITQAKRLYGVIGAGGVIGAIAGSGAASLLSRFVVAERLVLVSAFGFFVTGMIPLLFAEQPINPRAAEPVPTLKESFSVVGHDAYARRLVSALLIATVCLTISDFVFKSTIAEVVPKAQLGTFLGTVYFAVNVLSLLAQLWLVGAVLRRLSLGAALGVLPALLVVTGLGVAVSAGLIAVLALKAADGSIRYSLHRTTAELLCLPFGDEGRRRVKLSVDLVAQRGGQVLASLAILGLGAVHAPGRFLALALAALSACWLAAALSLRKPYVALFRARLRSARSHHIDEFPQLDVSSLETLLQSLESDNDREVLAALGVLERENKVHLVPALLIHHPSEQIVLRVLSLLASSGRKTALPTLTRIANHPSARVRAAALGARSVLDPDPEKIRALIAAEDSDHVRATITANLVVSGNIADAAEREQEIEALLRDGSAATRLAFAEAIGRRGAQGFDRVLTQLLGAEESEVRRAAVVAMGHVGSIRLFPELVGALADEITRADAEHSLAMLGVSAFDLLRARFEDTKTTTRLRWRIPPAMALCHPEGALSALLAWLPKENEGVVHSGILLVLERIVRQNPSLKVDKLALVSATRGTISRAYWYLDARLQLARGAAQERLHNTPGHELLRDLLRDKEASAKGRVFRLLGLLHPAEDLLHIYRSLSLSKELRATSVELIESILREPVRSAVLGLVDDCADELRLARSGGYHRSRPLGYRALLAELEQCDSDSLREVAQFHAQELGFASSITPSAQVA